MAHNLAGFHDLAADTGKGNGPVVFCLVFMSFLEGWCDVCSNHQGLLL